MCIFINRTLELVGIDNKESTGEHISLFTCNVIINLLPEFI